MGSEYFTCTDFYSIVAYESCHIPPHLCKSLMHTVSGAGVLFDFLTCHFVGTYNFIRTG